MALLNLQVDLTRTANALERIASALENFILLSDPTARRLAAIAANPAATGKSNLRDKFRRVTDEDLWQREMDEEAAQLSSQGLPSVLPET